MTYRTVLVQLDVGTSNAALLRAAGQFAARFEADIIGVAACQWSMAMYGDGTAIASIDVGSAEIERELRAAEAEFREVLGGRPEALHWRSEVTLEALADYVARQSRAADLIITGPGRAEKSFDARRQARADDLVMKAGRPVLIVPTGCDAIGLGHALVCWRDAREARRAIVDALPLLERAQAVTVVEIGDASEAARIAARLDDVVAWLRRHGVAAQPMVAPADGDVSLQLSGIARDHAVDLIVAGGYGHSRMREWVLGGVTRALLTDPERCMVLSH